MLTKATSEKAEPAADSDRKAAEYVLSLGGTVRVNGENRDINAAADLPRVPFRLTGSAFIRGTKKATEAGLAALKDCQNLAYLCLGRRT